MTLPAVYNSFEFLSYISSSISWTNLAVRTSGPLFIENDRVSKNLKNQIFGAIAVTALSSISACLSTFLGTSYKMSYIGDKEKILTIDIDALKKLYIVSYFQLKAEEKEYMESLFELKEGENHIYKLNDFFKNSSILRLADGSLAKIFPKTKISDFIVSYEKNTFGKVTDFIKNVLSSTLDLYFACPLAAPDLPSYNNYTAIVKHYGSILNISENQLTNFNSIQGSHIALIVDNFIDLFKLFKYSNIERSVLARSSLKFSLEVGIESFLNKLFPSPFKAADTIVTDHHNSNTFLNDMLSDKTLDYIEKFLTCYLTSKGKAQGAPEFLVTKFNDDADSNIQSLDNEQIIVGFNYLLGAPSYRRVDVRYVEVNDYNPDTLGLNSKYRLVSYISKLALTKIALEASKYLFKICRDKLNAKEDLKLLKEFHLEDLFNDDEIFSVIHNGYPINQDGDYNDAYNKDENYNDIYTLENENGDDHILIDA